MGLDTNDEIMINKATRFAIIFTATASVLVALPMLLLIIGGTSISIPFVSNLINKFSIVQLILSVVVHIAIALCVNLYFGLRGRYAGYYVRRKAADPLIQLTLISFGSRLGAAIASIGVIVLCTELLCRILGINHFSVIISIVLNTILMLWQRIHYTPERAMML